MNLSYIVVLLQAVLVLLSNPNNAQNAQVQALASQAISMAQQALTSSTPIQPYVQPYIAPSQPVQPIIQPIVQQPIQPVIVAPVVPITTPSDSPVLGAVTPTSTPVVKTHAQLINFGSVVPLATKTIFDFACGSNWTSMILTVNSSTFTFPVKIGTSELVLDNSLTGITSASSSNILTDIDGKVNWFPYTLECETATNYDVEKGYVYVPIQ